MAQLNRNAAYLYEVDGLTVWERLRVIRGFLNDRRKALALAELGLEEFEHKKKDMDTDSFKYRRMIIENSDLESNMQDAKDEIAFLEDLEDKLSSEAEKTRIEGKSDREMYEINFFEEKIQRNLLKARAEIAATNHIRPETMEMFLREPETLRRACELQMLPKDAINLAPKPLLVEDRS